MTLRLIQPKTTAMANICVKTATDALTQVAIRRVRASDGSEGTSPIARSRLAARTWRSGKKPIASFGSIYDPPVLSPIRRLRELYPRNRRVKEALNLVDIRLLTTSLRGVCVAGRTRSWMFIKIR
jgi:hypothetical protein